VAAAHGRHAGVMDGPAAWLAAPLEELQRVFDGQDGNGPLGGLTAAAAAVLDAAAPLRTGVPAELAGSLERLAAALALAAEAVA